MKKIVLSMFFLVVANTAFSVTGLDVMNMMDKKATPDYTHMLVELIIVEENGSEKNRIIEMWGDSASELSSEIMVFRSPASVKDTRFLIKETPDGDDKWIFMPALGKVRRIAASDNGSSFMGTEFTYADMSGTDIDDDNHTLLKEEELNGYNCYVVESIPKDDTDSQYSRRVQWIVKDNDILIPIKVELYNKDAKLNKVLTISDLVNIDGFWIPNATKMENLLNNRSSIINNQKVELNKKINPALFEKRFLTTGKVQ
ncbi:MAG: outer membrane lipoprotein-sorting protein [Spirochaetales bacterium]|nr:outer membrane lipoprotein-sorting protein [Spirochaetales bacterium]